MILRPFRAIDGEADPADEAGRQNYNLLVAGKRTLHPAIKEYLTSGEIFEFLLDLPPHPILVGYYIGYDVTMWLRDVPAKKVERLLIEDKRIFGNYTYWCGWGMQYIPGQFFRVCRLDGNSKPIEGSSRTVNEVAGFFRGPFLDALATMQVGTAGQIAEIRAGKAARGKETLPPEQTERYCKLECTLLAKAMTRLGELCTDIDMMPHSWRGAGQLASRLLKLHELPQRPKEPTRPARVDVSHEEHRYPDSSKWRTAVMTAYFGGRIETSATGHVPGPVWSYDLHSAYPAAMAYELPCPKHTDWHPFQGAPRGWEWYLAKGRWIHDRPQFPLPWGPLPTRTKAQAIIYPQSAAGWWWSPELHDLDGFQFDRGWGAERQCDCNAFAWLSELFEQRKKLGPYRGLPLKIAMAALYGKLGQRRHMQSARWRDLILAGLITSSVRAKIRDTLTAFGNDILAVSTDGILSAKRLPMKVADSLGFWSEECLRDGIFIVQPGIFWTPDRNILKARGFARQQMLDTTETLEKLWNEAPPWAPPSYDMPVDMFIGHKAAKALDNHELAGTWRRMKVQLSFDWSARRSLTPKIHASGTYVTTLAPDRHQKSQPYDPSMINEMEKIEEMLREQPDAV